MATIKDVAAVAGVSFTTVSHVVNNSRPVSADVRAKVELAIRELNYVPSAVARSLMSPATATAFEPAEVISSMTSEASKAAAMSLTTTVAPWRARPSASASPRPAAAPVTTATLPERSVAFVLLVNL